MQHIFALGFHDIESNNASGLEIVHQRLFRLHRLHRLLVDSHSGSIRLGRLDDDSSPTQELRRHRIFHRLLRRLFRLFRLLIDSHSDCIRFWRLDDDDSSPTQEPRGPSLEGSGVLVDSDATPTHLRHIIHIVERERRYVRESLAFDRGQIARGYLNVVVVDVASATATPKIDDGVVAHF